MRYPLSYRDIEELFLERGLEVDHSTLNRWVLVYAPLIERRLRTFRKPLCGSVRIDETYIKIRGQWRHLYRALVTGNRICLGWSRGRLWSTHFGPAYVHGLCRTARGPPRARTPVARPTPWPHEPDRTR